MVSRSATGLLLSGIGQLPKPTLGYSSVTSAAPVARLTLRGRLSSAWARLVAGGRPVQSGSRGGPV